MERNTTKNFEYGIFTRFDLDQRICRVWFGTKTIELEHIDIPLDKEIEFSDADYVFLLNLEIELYSILLAKNAREKYPELRNPNTYWMGGPAGKPDNIEPLNGKALTKM